MDFSILKSGIKIDEKILNLNTKGGFKSEETRGILFLQKRYSKSLSSKKLIQIFWSG
jgi:hypothetical protein